jgi:protein arginine kinase
VIDALLAHPPPWLDGAHDEHSIAISSRIRLARNLAELPFPHSCSSAQRDDVIERVLEAAARTTLLKDAHVFIGAALEPLDRQFLMERHLVSPEFIQHEGPSALLVSNDQSCAIMINEEDHLRMQILQPGMQLAHTWAQMDQLDNELEQTLPYAFSSRYGYLTACPTNVGTGLRASVMLYLPALVHARKIGGMISAVGKVGVAVRGLYGEHSDARGNLFQVSNQITLGRGELDIVQQLAQIVERIMRHEEQRRQALINEEPHELRNSVGRAFGTLRYAEILTSEEATNLLSILLMGIDLGVFDKIERRVVSELLLDIQPAHLQARCGRALESGERDLERARFIRDRLGGFDQETTA